MLEPFPPNTGAAEDPLGTSMCLLEEDAGSVEILWQGIWRMSLFSLPTVEEHFHIVLCMDRCIINSSCFMCPGHETRDSGCCKELKAFNKLSPVWCVPATVIGWVAESFST